MRKEILRKIILFIYFLSLPVIIYIFLYVTVIQNRTQRCLAVYKKYQPQFLPLPDDWLKYPLSNFYIATSHRSYLPCGNYYDLASYDALSNNLQAGARFIHLDVYSNGQYLGQVNNDTKLIVAPGKNPLEGRQLTLMPIKGEPLDFTKCCQTINSLAWLNNQYPLFLYLDLHLFGNIEMANKGADTIVNIFGNRLLNKKYGYQRISLGEIPLEDTVNKVVIITSSYPTNSRLDELTNAIISEKNQTLNNLEISYQNLDYGLGNIHDQENLKDLNKKYMTRVSVKDYNSPYNFISPKADVYNLDSKPLFNLGCQMVSMNYQLDDNYLTEYLAFFKERSLVLKPDSLRYVPGKTKSVENQNPKFYFKPREVNDPGWVTFKF